ncbi:MAG: hypothetical protein FWH39_04635, partial [Bacteroidales bacterium]|nr:hypothetical protein [Bacteroidales bacterium]
SSDLGSLWLFGCLFVNVLDGWRYGQKQIKCICPVTTVVSHLQHFFKPTHRAFSLDKTTSVPHRGLFLLDGFQGERFNCFAADAAIKVRQDLHMDNLAQA